MIDVTYIYHPPPLNSVPVSFAASPVPVISYLRVFGDQTLSESHWWDVVHSESPELMMSSALSLDLILWFLCVLKKRSV